MNLSVCYVYTGNSLTVVVGYQNGILNKEHPQQGPCAEDAFSFLQKYMNKE